MGEIEIKFKGELEKRIGSVIKKAEEEKRKLEDCVIMQSVMRHTRQRCEDRQWRVILSSDTDLAVSGYWLFDGPLLLLFLAPCIITRNWSICNFCPH